MKKPNKNPVGRPKTGRKLVRYWLKPETIKEISRRAKSRGFRKDFNFIECVFGKKL